MASTNHTTNYNLSQFIGTDKPTWLGDYNGDMGKIDAQMKTNADNVATAISASETATSTANSAVSTANSASATATSAQSTANSASTTADNAQSTANSALSTATSAQTTANSANTKAEAIASKLNLTSFETINQNNITVSGGGVIANCTLNTAVNADGSIGKIYGVLNINCNNAGGTIVIPTQLRPKDSLGVATDLTVNGVVLRNIGNGNTLNYVTNVTMTIKANGNVELPYGWVLNPNDYNNYIFIATVLFLTPFNDEPIPESNN